MDANNSCPIHSYVPLVFLSLYCIIVTMILLIFIYQTSKKIKDSICNAFPVLDESTSGKTIFVIQGSLGALLSFVFVCFFHNWFFSLENEYLRSFYFVMYSLISPIIGVFAIKVLEDVKDFQILRDMNRLDNKRKSELKDKYNEYLKKRTEKMI